jgi:flagellin
MTSLLTNSSAMVALQTLRSINTNLDQTNNRVSTGLRVNTAADNAAYWSIATTIKSDNGALGAVTDSLSLGASTLSTTYTGLDTAKTSLNDLKNQLTTATGENVDKAKIQQTIASIQAQLKSVADAASFSGQNWLSTGSDTNFSKSIVSSLSRDSNNQLTIGTIGVDITKIRLYGNGTSQVGILDKTINLDTYTADSGTAATVETAAIDFAHADDNVSFTVSQNGGAAVTVNINQTTLTEAGLSDTKVRSNADLAAVLNQALKDSSISGVTAGVDSSDHVIFSSLDNFDISGASAVGGSTLDVTDLGLKATALTTSSAPVGATSVADIDITSASSATIQGYLRVVDQALSEVTDAASSVGAYQNRVTSQQNFVKALQDANTTAVGALVDANMEEESTKLKALQTQQQLAVQSLSIANASTSNILTLFR